MSRKARVEMIGRGRPKPSVSRQCKLVGVSRSSLYYRPVGPDQEDLDIMAKMDRQYLKSFPVQSCIDQASGCCADIGLKI